MSFVGQGGGIMPATILANMDDARFMEAFIVVVESLPAEGKIKAHPVSVREGGLRRVLEGLRATRGGKVSGEKLVYRISDTV